MTSCIQGMYLYIILVYITIDSNLLFKGVYILKQKLQFFQKLKVKLSLSFIIILLLPGLIIGLLSYLTAKDAVEEEVLTGVLQNVNLLNTSIDSTIEPKAHDLEVFSQWITVDLYREDSTVKTKFKEYIQLHPEAQSIYVGTESGSLIMEPAVTLPPDFDPRVRDWYKQAMEKKGELIVSEPYVSADTGEMVITLSQTTKDATGVIGVDLNIASLQQLVESIQIGENGFAVLLDKNKKFITHPTKEAGTQVQGDHINQIFADEKGFFQYQEQKIVFDTNSRTGWKLAGVIMSDEVNQAAAPIFNKTGMVLLISYFVGALLVVFIIRSIIKPINKLKIQANHIKDGDLTQKIDIKTKDEIGQLALAFNDMQESLKALVQKIEQNSELVTASAEELTASAEQTSEATLHVAEAIQEVASSAEIQSNGVNKSTYALKRVSEGVSKVNDNCIQMLDLVKHTTSQADVGGQAVTNTVNQMDSIQKSVEESNSIIQTLYDTFKRS